MKPPVIYPAKTERNTDRAENVTSWLLTEIIGSEGDSSWVKGQPDGV